MGGEIRTSRARGGDVAPATVVDSEERIRESYSDYLCDESRLGPSHAERLIFARSEEQIADALLEAGERGEKITISAGRTGVVGGAVPEGGTVLSLAEMKRILGVRRTPDGRWAVRAEPGISIAELAARLASKDLGTDRGRLGGDDGRALDEFLNDPAEYVYMPDPTEDTALLGGTIATNASGARSFRYGSTREHILGLRICLASGEVLDLTRGAARASGGRFVVASGDGERHEVKLPTYAMPDVKNAAGYFAAPDMDLVDLFIGSEGTLGVITEAEVVLCPKPEGMLSALAFFPSDEDAVEFVVHARGDLRDAAPPDSVSPVALEFFDSKSLAFLRERKSEEGPGSEIPDLPGDAAAGILFEQEYVEETLVTIYEGWEKLLLAHGSSMESTWGGMEDADLARLKALRHGIAEQVNGFVARARQSCPGIHKIGTDTVVPRGALVDTFRSYSRSLERSGLRHVVFGHIGDSHLHANIMPTTEEELSRAKELARAFARYAVEHSGSVSGEHGIGKLKQDFLLLMYGERGVSEMAAVKRALDPRGVLNAGVMFPAGLV